MADIGTWVFYRLPETIVEIAGSVTTKTNLEADLKERSTDAKVTLLTRADPATYFRVDSQKLETG